jgi:hypothetical protein
MYVLDNVPLQGYGILWVVIGVIIYGFYLGKTENYGIPTAILVIYLGLVGNKIHPELWIFFVLIMTLGIAYMLYSLIKGDGN